MSRTNKKINTLPVIEVTYRNFDVNLGSPKEFIDRGCTEAWEPIVYAVPRKQEARCEAASFGRRASKAGGMVVGGKNSCLAIWAKELYDLVFLGDTSTFLLRRRHTLACS